MDSYKNFVTFKTDRTILEAAQEGSRTAAPLFRIARWSARIATYEKKYKIKLQKPVQVEVYPDHEDFAVRTLGMPGLGALGVTFGYAVAMDSPSGRTPGQFHWARTLWHEMSHVFTLTMTGSSRAALVHRRHRGARRDRRLAGVGRPARPRRDRAPSRTTSCCRSPSWIAASCIPVRPRR